MSDLKDDNLNDRRAKLDAALAQKKSKKNDQVVNGGAGGKAGWGLAVKISSEFIAGVLMGALIGYVLDSLAGTAPWGMIVFLLLGFGAGLLNVLRSTGKVAQPENRMSDTATAKNNNRANYSGENEQED